MIKSLRKIRTPNKYLTNSQKIINTILIFLLGLGLGIFAKWLDNTSINDGIWWQHILGVLDLGNVFSLFGVWILIAVCISIYSTTPLRASLHVFLFFLGMNISYHLYTIFFAGFNPLHYMLIWYAITLVSPFLGFICWYAKGKGEIALIINICIIAATMLCSFNIGIWYFDFTSIIEGMFFIITLIVLYDTPKRSIISILGALILNYLFSIF